MKLYWLVLVGGLLSIAAIGLIVGIVVSYLVG